MHSFFRSAVWIVVGVLCLCGLPPPAFAQLRSFAAIRTFELDPPLPGTEKIFAELSEFFKLLSPAYRRPWWPPRAYCTLRADLPKPRVLGLECRDPAGSYIGTLRAKNTGELRDRLREYCFQSQAAPTTLPLTQYRYIYVEGPTKKDADRVAGLLRADPAWQVVTHLDRVPADEEDHLLLCWVIVPPEPDLAAHAWEWEKDRNWVPEFRSALALRDSRRHIVRVITGGSGWASSRALRDAVHKLLELRQLDEEVHGPLVPGPREPK